MRNAFIQTLCQLAAEDERIWLLTGDLGFSVLETFADNFPDRFVNVGVAEQNMMGIAAGLALSGKIPLTYSIANFAFMRCLEQIRNDVCYHRLNVKVVAVGGGVAYAAQGYTHHGVEDLGILRLLPNLTVLAPGDPMEARWATRTAVGRSGPFYIRLGKGGEPVVHPQEPSIALGQAMLLRDGGDLSLLCTGSVLPLAIQAADILTTRGLTVKLFNFPTIAPMDQASVLECVRSTGRIVTVEEHGPGGLASAVSEIVASSGNGIRFHPIRLQRTGEDSIGDQDFLRARQGISVEGIVESCMLLLC